MMGGWNIMDYVPVPDEEEQAIFKAMAEVFDAVEFDPLTEEQAKACHKFIARYNSPETLKLYEDALRTEPDGDDKGGGVDPRSL